MGHHFHFVKVGGHEMVSLPAPVLRRDMKMETRQRFLPFKRRTLCRT